MFFLYAINIFLTMSKEDDGSPLMKSIRERGKNILFMIGITVHRFDSEEGTFLRFARIHTVLGDIGEIVKRLESDTAENNN